MGNKHINNFMLIDLDRIAHIRAQLGQGQNNIQKLEKKNMVDQSAQERIVLIPFNDLYSLMGRGTLFETFFETFFEDGMIPVNLKRFRLIDDANPKYESLLIRGKHNRTAEGLFENKDLSIQDRHRDGEDGEDPDSDEYYEELFQLFADFWDNYPNVEPEKDTTAQS